ncbi:MAG: CBS domain-containing protein [Chloroflexota bacterium]
MKRTPGRRSIFGVRIRAHYTCAGACVLVAAIVATQLPENYSFWQKAVLGVSAALLYLALLIVRELVLNLASDRGRSPVKEVTLFAFGGVSQTAEELILPGHELLMAAARLLSSLVTTAVLYGVYALSVNYGNLTVAGVTEWLVFIWSSLFLLNILPGFPLDTGMALRAILLKRSGDYQQATYTASTVGWSAGLLFIFSGGLVFIVTQQWLVGLVVTVVGWCLQSASAVMRRQAALVMALEFTEVRNVMTGEYEEIDINVTVDQLFREHILVSGWRYYVVTDGAALKGVLTARKIKSVSWRRWNSTRAGDIMTPLGEIGTAYPEQSGASALQEMYLRRMDSMPVLDGGGVVGVVARDRLVGLGKTRAEFEV